MYRIVYIVGLCLILSSCFASNKMGVSPSSSEVSSIKIGQPDGLSQEYAEGGYSLCLERVNHDEVNCSKSIFQESSWKNETTIKHDLNNDCTSGYKLKMWLWKDSANKTKRDSVFVLSSAGKENTVENGYVNIEKSKLKGGTLDLNLVFKRLDGNTVVSGDPSKVGIEIVPIIVDSDSEGSDSGKKEDSGTKQTVSTTGSGDFDFECNTKDKIAETSDAKGMKGNGGRKIEGGGNNVPNGKVNEVKSSENLKTGGYPVLIMYGFDGCGACSHEKDNILTSTNVAKLKEKMHVYHVETRSLGPCGGGYPQNQFFNAEGEEVACQISYGGVQQMVKKLSGVKNF